MTWPAQSYIHTHVNKHIDKREERGKKRRKWPEALLIDGGNSADVSDLRRGCSHSESKDEISLCNSKNASLFSCEREGGKKNNNSGFMRRQGTVSAYVFFFFLSYLLYGTISSTCIRALPFTFFFFLVSCGKAKTAVAQRRRFLANSLGYLQSNLFCCCYFQSSFFFFFSIQWALLFFFSIK